MKKYALVILLSFLLILPGAAYAQDAQKFDEIKQIERQIQARQVDSIIVKYKDSSFLGKGFKSSVSAKIDKRDKLTSDVELITVKERNKMNIIMNELQNDPDVAIVEPNTICYSLDEVNNQTDDVHDNYTALSNRLSEQKDNLNLSLDTQALPMLSKMQSSTGSSITETEYNNTMQDADLISLNSTVCGTITDVYYDLDYYRIEINQSGELAIVGILGYSPNYSEYLGIALCNAAGEVIDGSRYVLADDVACQALFADVTPGIYYIVILQTSDSHDLLVDEVYCFLTELTVTTAPVPVSSVHMTCNKLKMLNNTSQQLSYYIAPPEASNRTVNWSSGNNKIASVDSAGKVTAKNTGTTTITVTTQDGGQQDHCLLEVVNSFPVNDPGFGRQWGLEAMHAPNTWNYIGTTREEPITVAVIDTGIDTGHEDLTNRLAPNGYNFILNNNDIYDINGHGSMVSGVIAAQANNSKGIAGIAGSLNVKILPLQAGYYDGSMYLADQIRAIDYAVQQGADVINMSFCDANNSMIRQQFIQEAVNEGIIIVAAAGNYSAGYYAYPASHDGVISVGSISESGDISYFSQHNDQIDFVAPGNNIYTTKYDNSYVFASGTSLSAPFVAGVVAMLKAINPALTPQEIDNVLIDTAVDKGRAGKDNYYGYGLIDPYEAIKAISFSQPQLEYAVLDAHGNPRAGWPIKETLNNQLGKGSRFHVEITDEQGNFYLDHNQNGRYDPGEEAATWDTSLNMSYSAQGRYMGHNMNRTWDTYTINDAEPEPDIYLYPNPKLAGHQLQVKVVCAGQGLSLANTTDTFTTPFDLTRQLAAGSWQAISTPKYLAKPNNSAGYGTFGDLLPEDSMHLLLYWDVNRWVVKSGSEAAALVMEPLKGYYVRTNGSCTANYVFARATTPEQVKPPTRTINQGWCAVGLAVRDSINDGTDDITRQQDYLSRSLNPSGVKLVYNPGKYVGNLADFISAGVNQGSWAGQNTLVYNGDYYWLYMNEPSIIDAGVGLDLAWRQEIR